MSNEGENIKNRYLQEEDYDLTMMTFYFTHFVYIDIFNT